MTQQENIDYTTVNYLRIIRSWCILPKGGCTVHQTTFVLSYYEIYYRIISSFVIIRLWYKCL